MLTVSAYVSELRCSRHSKTLQGSEFGSFWGPAAPQKHWPVTTSLRRSPSTRSRSQSQAIFGAWMAPLPAGPSSTSMRLVNAGLFWRTKCFAGCLCWGSSRVVSCCNALISSVAASLVSRVLKARSTGIGHLQAVLQDAPEAALTSDVWLQLRPSPNTIPDVCPRTDIGYPNPGSKAHVLQHPKPEEYGLVLTMSVYCMSEVSLTHSQ